LRAFEVVTEKYLGQVELGHVGRITYPLFGLANGFSGVVSRLGRNPGRAPPQTDSGWIMAKGIVPLP
jgi:hypothetical protein